MTGRDDRPAIESSEALLARYQRAWSELDADTIVELMTPDGVYEASFGPEPYGQRFVGREAIRRAVLGFKTGPHPGSHEYGETYLFGSHAFATWTSVQRGPDGAVLASTHGCDFYELRDGLVARKIAYRKSLAR